MIIVTGGAGFIGSNLVAGLNRQGYDNVVVVDNLTDGIKYRNLLGCRVADYWDKQAFIDRIRANEIPSGLIKAIFHQGACSATTEWNGRYLMDNNYEYSKELFHYCQHHGIPLIYASSAAVYGTGAHFAEDVEHEAPLNIYGYSKYQFDQYFRRHQDNLGAQVVGLRYFNVYGPRESHKGAMASVAFHFYQQLKSTGKVKLFEGCDGYADGEQRRDFVSVDDVVDLNLWFLENPQVSGIFNIGTGRSQTFNEVAKAVLDYHQNGELEYIPFPEHLKGCYQSFTEADLTRLRAAGCTHEFKTVEQGVALYMQWLDSQ